MMLGRRLSRIRTSAAMMCVTRRPRLHSMAPVSSEPGGDTRSALFATASSTLADPVAAAEACLEQIGDQLQGKDVQLCIFFAGQHAANPELRRVPPVLERLGPDAAILGCSADQGVLDASSGTMIEDMPALSVFAAILPATSVETFRVPVEYDFSVSDAGEFTVLSFPPIPKFSTENTTTMQNLSLISSIFLLKSPKSAQLRVLVAP